MASPDAPLATDLDNAQALAERLEAISSRYRTGAPPVSMHPFQSFLDPRTLLAPQSGPTIDGVAGATELARAIFRCRSHFADAVRASSLRVHLAAQATSEADRSTS